MTTREEFLETMARYTIAITTPPYDGIDTGNALIAAYDALAARIEELEDGARIRMANLCSLESHSNWQNDRIAELEAALRAFAPNNIKPGHWALADQNTDDPHEWYCKHCKARAGEWQDIEHAPDCPVTLARTVLSKEAHLRG